LSRTSFLGQDQIWFSHFQFDSMTVTRKTGNVVDTAEEAAARRKQQDSGELNNGTKGLNHGIAGSTESLLVGML